MLTRIIKYLLFIMTFCFCHLTSHGQNRNIDSLLVLLKTDKPDTNKVTHLYELTYQCQLTGDYLKGVNYGKEALELAHKLDFKKGIARASHNIGIIYLYQADYPNALDYFYTTLKLYEEQKYNAGITVLLCNIGLIYLNQGDYPKALDYNLKASKMAEEFGYNQIQATNLINIGIIYQKQGDYPKALRYYFMSLKKTEESGDKKLQTTNLGNIGAVYCNQRDYSKALYYYNKALKMEEESGNRLGISIDIGNIGEVYSYQKDYLKALDFYFRALKISEELGDKNLISIHITNIGFIYTEMGKFNEAERYLKRAIAINDSIGALDYLRQTEESLSHLYDTTKRYKEALIHYKKAIALKDTIFSQENKKQLVRKEMNYEFDKKETAAKAIQDKKDAVTAEEKQKQKVIIYSVSIGLFLVLLLALFILIGYRQKRKANIIITQQKAEVEKQKELVEEKNKEITDSINYARRIQQAKLPKKEEIYVALSQSFILFKPKDIVSGDFYFFHKNERIVFIASADCTGHGVPGAFMSMIGSEKLSDAVSQSIDTSEILKQLNKGIKTSLHQSDSNDSTRDGMDIALCTIDTENRIVKYAGANRPIWIIRKGQTEVEETKATKKAIGGFTDDKQHFDTHEFNLQQGDTFYIFTDGYADQFGGEDGKKLMTKKFKEILLDIQCKTMQEQEKHLETFADDWLGKREQIDDILVIGVRL